MCVFPGIPRYISRFLVEKGKWCCNDSCRILCLIVLPHMLAIAQSLQFEDFNTSAVLRQTAAAYMASYVARAKFVSLE